jgi:hypothetical protein
MKKLIPIYIVLCAIFSPLACTKIYTLSPVPIPAVTLTPTATFTPTFTPTPSSSCSNSGTATTLAGSGVYGFVNGTGTGASFGDPAGVSVDTLSTGIYVADKGNNVIRKITALGVVTTFAGSGSVGAVNATGTAASFNDPWGVAEDGFGNIYVADTGNNLIRLITPAGVVSTFAGSGVAGSANGTGTAASFNGPTGVALDASGNVYVADFYNNMIRKITSGGVVTTLAGSGTAGFVNATGGSAEFNWPGGVAVDSAGNVYVGDENNNVIRKVTAGGVVSTFAGTGVPGVTNGAGTVARFWSPFGMAIDSFGNIYVGDRSNNMIREITPGAIVSTLSGTGVRGSTNGVATVATFNGPLGVATDSGGCNVYVADDSNQLVRVLH